MQAISIQKFLLDIRENAGEPFLLGFVRSSGKKKGSIKIVAKCLYGSVRPKAPTERPKVTPEAHKQHVVKGTLPMYDLEREQYITPLISHIVQYNLQKVIH